MTGERTHLAGCGAALLVALFLCAPPAAAAPVGAPTPGPFLTLPQAIEDAIENNPTLQKVRKETEASRGDVIRARAAFLPQIEAGGGIEHTIHQPSVTVHPNTFGNPDSVYFPLADRTVPYASASVEQMVYDFGRSTNKYREAKTMAKARSLAEELAAQDLALAVTQSYLDVLLAREKVELAASTLAAYDSHARTARRLYGAGAIPQSDLLAADVARSQAALEQSAAQNDVRVAELAFEKIVGVPPGALDRGAMAFRRPSLEIEALSVKAKEQRLELALNERAQQIAKAQKSAATSEYLPDVFARARVLYREDSYASQKDQVFLTAGMRWPLFDGLAAYGSRKKAQSTMAATEHSRQALLDTIEMEVTRAHLDLKQAIRATEVAKANMGEASENLRIVKERYAAGDAPASEVLDGIASWKGAVFAHAQALHDAGLAMARLARATGDSLTGAQQ